MGAGLNAVMHAGLNVVIGAGRLNVAETECAAIRCRTECSDRCGTKCSTRLNALLDTRLNVVVGAGLNGKIDLFMAMHDSKTGTEKNKEKNLTCRVPKQQHFQKHFLYTIHANL